MKWNCFVALIATFFLPTTVVAGDSKSTGKTYNVPYRLTQTSHILVRVKINGQGPLNFIVDTGAPIVIISSEGAEEINLKSGGFAGILLEEKGKSIRIAQVVPGSPAAKGGLKDGDVIRRVNKIKISSVDQLQRVLTRAGAQTEVSFVVRRKKETKKVTFRLGKRGWASAKTFAIEGGIVHKDLQVLVQTIPQISGMNAMNFAGVPLHGVIGFPLLAKYKMEIDFTQPKMRWTDLKFTPPAPQPITGKKPSGSGMSSLDAASAMMRMMRLFVGKFPTTEIVARGFVGVELRDEDGTIKITNVLPSSPAAKKGLKAGDVILTINDKRYNTIEGVLKQLSRVPTGKGLTFEIRRGDQKKSITLTTANGL
ncbi:MAG: PDZ domain-containing protein [Gemmataceae bacterium]